MMGRVTADDGAFRTAVEPAEGSSDGRPPRPSDEAHEAAEAREDGEGPDEATPQVAAAQDAAEVAGAAEVAPEVRAQDLAAARRHGRSSTDHRPDPAEAELGGRGAPGQRPAAFVFDPQTGA
jgi:hypothetical protein